MDQESVVLEIDPRSVHAAIVQANKDVESWEKGTVGAGERMQKSLERMADMLIKLNDKSRSSMERLTQSIEKQAAAYGKTGVERLVAERDRIIKKLGDEQAMIERVRASYEKMIAVEEKNNGGGVEGFGKQIEQMVRDPLNGAKEAATGLLEKIGPMGGALAVGVGALAAFAAAGWEAAKSLGEYGVKVADVELRTGLTAKEVGQFGFAARAAGQDVSIFERIMRGLTTAVEDDSKAGQKARDTLRSLGVDIAGVRNGSVPTSEVLLQISRGLEALPTTWERNKAAMDLFKRAGIEAIPVMLELNENVKRAKELGFGPSEEDVKRFKAYQKQVTEISDQWDRLVRKMKEPFVIPVLFFLNWAVGDTQKESPTGVMRAQMGQAGAGSLNEDASTELRQYLHDYIAHKYAPGMPTGAQVQAPYVAAAERRAADAALRADPTFQLKEAEAALAKMAPPQIGVSSLKEVQDYRAAEARVEALKKQIEGTKELVSTLQAAQRELAGVHEVDPFTVLARQRDEAMGAAFGKYGANAGPLIDTIKQTYDAKWVKEFNTEVEKTNKELETEAMRWNRLTVEAAHAKETAFKQEELTGLERFDKQAMEDLKARIANAREWEKFYDEEKFGRMGAAGSFAERAIVLTSTGGEVQTLAQQIQVREAIRAEELKIKEAHEDIYDVDQERWKAELANLQDRYQYEEKILEVQRKERDGIKNTAAGLFRTLLTKPGQFPKQFENTIHEAVIRPVAEGLGGMAASALSPVIFGGDGQSGIAGIFRGAFGGKGKLADVKLIDGAVPVHIMNLPGGGAGTSIYSIGGVSGGGGTVSIGGGAAGIINLPTNRPDVLNPWALAGISGGAGGGGTPDITNLPTNRPGVLNPWSLAGLGGGGTGGGTGTGAGGGGLFGQILNGNFAKGSTTAGFHPSQILANLKNTNWGGFTRNDQGSINGVNGVAGAALFTGGTMLATNGLMGNNRGTWTGVGEGALGGAMIGLQMGGPLGGAIGAAVGAGIGVGEKIAGVESPENEAKRLVKQIYNISIDNSMAQKIVAVAQQKYANHVSIAVRDPDIRKMLQLYAEGTDQKFPLSATAPVGGSLVEQGGNLYQQASYVNGQPYTFQSSLPVLGGFSTGTYPNAGLPSTMASGGGVNLALNINGQPITPEFVADQSIAAQGASYGRTEQAANMQVPGLMVA